MNGLKNGVVIESFDLPSNAKEGGIALTLNTSVTNVSLLLKFVKLTLAKLLTDIAFASRHRTEQYRIPKLLPVHSHWPRFFSF